MPNHETADFAFPKIEGPIDELKALRFARAVLLAVGLRCASTAECKDDVQRVILTIDGLLETAENLDETHLKRINYIEELLAKDGLAVVIYLKANQVREHLLASNRQDISKAMSDKDLAGALQSVMLTKEMPPPLAQFATAMEVEAAKQIICQNDDELCQGCTHRNGRR